MKRGSASATDDVKPGSEHSMTSSQFALATLVLAILGTVSASGAQTAGSSSGNNEISNATLAYVGTYTGGKSQGIYLFRLETHNPEDSQNALLVPLGLAAEIASPAF